MSPRGGLAFLGGTVITADPQRPRATGVYVEDGLIKAVGPAEEVRRLLPPEARVVDLTGKTLVPGFVDAHNHMLATGDELGGVDFSYPRVASIHDLVETLREAVARTPGGQWIKGGAMDYGKYPEGRMPTRWDIDPVSPEHPVLITHVSGHFALVNSVALEMAGVTDETPDPPGGKLVRDEKGRLTGMLLDAAQQVVLPVEVDVGNHGPGFHTRMPLDELVECVARANNAYVRAGITSVVDAQVTRREMAGYIEARRRGLLQVRVTCMYLSNHLSDLKALGLNGPLGDDHLAIGPLKFYCDGSLIGKTALFYEPYTDGSQGYPYHPEEELKALVREAVDYGLQVGIHTQGDRAIDIVLSAYREALRTDAQVERWHRIEHCGYPTEGQLRQIRELGLVPVVQPRYIYEVGDNFIANMGRERASRLIPVRSMLELGIPAALSTDASVASYRPLDTIEAAVTRTTRAGEPLGPEERITVEQAVVCYTANAARSAHLYDRGVIGPGKRADLVVIGGDLLNTPPEQISKLPVEMTVIDGQVVYQAGSR